MQQSVFPPGNNRNFEECGYEVRRIKGLKCVSPVAMAHVTEEELRDGVRELDGDDVDAVIQVGTNLAMARLARCAHLCMQRPVLAINTAIYWHALRESGIDDRITGFGPLLGQH